MTDIAPDARPDAAPDTDELLALLDLGGRVVALAPAPAGAGLGTPWSGLLGRALADRVHEDDRGLVERALARLAGGAAHEEVAHRLVRPDGRVVRVRTAFTAVRDAAGAVTVVGRVRAVADRAATGAPDALADLATAFELAPLGMALVALDGRWMRVNAALCELLGYTEEELRTMRFQELTHPDDLELDLRLLQETVEGRRAGYQMDKRYLHASGRVIHAGLLVAAVAGSDGRPVHFIAQIHDLTARHDLDESLRMLARADPLTGLLNRRSFAEELDRELQRCARHGTRANMAVIDLDGFKAVNDSQGHAAGDGVLRDVAARLSERVRASDVVGRLGGDEFVVLLCGVGLEEAVIAARGFADAIGGGAGTAVTASIGLTDVRPGDTADQVMARADQAMYRAKRVGPGKLAVSQAKEASG